MAYETVLVTGGAGFIGSYVVQHLVKAGYQPVVYDKRAPKPELRWLLRAEQNQIRYEYGPINDGQRLRAIYEQYTPGAIIHAAAIADPVYLSTHPMEAVQVNLMSTINALELARTGSVRRLVYFSSIAVLPRIQYEPVDVQHPLILANQGPGGSFYGASKLAGEAFCFAYGQSFGVDVVIVRPSAVYGFGMGYPIYIKPMVENAVLGKPTVFDNGRDFPRDYTHVRDVVQLTWAALQTPADKVRDRVFYAATGQPLVTAGQVAELVRQQIPSAQIQVGEGLSAADLVEISYRGVLDISNARQQLGYVPAFPALRDGIAEYISLLREYYGQADAG